MTCRRWSACLVLAAALGAGPARAAGPDPAGFRVSPGEGRSWPASGGRLVVAIAPADGPAEPWTAIDRVGPGEIALLGVDVPPGTPPGPVRVGPGATTFPGDGFATMPSGRRRVQALLMANRDLWRVDAPGNRVGRAVTADLGRGGAVDLDVAGALPEETLPPDTGLVRYRRIRSARLSSFWGRDLFVRVGVVLPRGHADEPSRRYPVVVDAGGFGARFTRVAEYGRAGSRALAEWMADDTPRMILVALDGAGPLGDPYYVDSAAGGPWGSALLEEALPEIEREFRGMGEARARFTTGGSTGGWVSLALQVLHPDSFGGCWSGYPDPVDFHDFELIDLYADANAFVGAGGREKAAARTRSGRVEFTVRHEVRHENVLGPGGSFVRGGGQWGSWNAAFGPRAADGGPAAAWDPRTGAIDRAVAREWGRFDLVRILSRDWPVLAPRLRGKLHVWVGESDEYYLERAVRRLDAFLRAANPPADAEVRFGPGQGHGWDPHGFAGRLRAMQRALDGR